MDSEFAGNCMLPAVDAASAGDATAFQKSCQPGWHRFAQLHGFAVRIGSHVTDGTFKSSLSKTKTQGNSRMAAARFASVRGKRSTNFSGGTSCPPWETRMPTRCSDVAGSAIPTKQRTTA